MKHDQSELLARRCEEHMRQEEGYLMRVVDVLQQLQGVLRTGGWERVAELSNAQEDLTQTAARLHDARATLRHETGAARLSSLFSQVPTAARQSLEMRLAQVGSLAQQARRLSGTNQQVARELLVFMERFFLELAGGQPDQRSYGPSGDLRQAACGSLIEARG